MAVLRHASENANVNNPLRPGTNGFVSSLTPQSAAVSATHSDLNLDAPSELRRLYIIVNNHTQLWHTY